MFVLGDIGGYLWIFLDIGEVGINDRFQLKLRARR